MKNLLFILSATLLLSATSSCHYHDDGNVHIRYSKHSHYYKMKARFRRNKTRAIERYLDHKLETRGMSFRNTRIDGQITLDDKSTFYIKKYPGYLYIRFDRDENSERAYIRIRELCEAIEDMLND